MLQAEPQKLMATHRHNVHPVMAGLAGVVAGAAGVTIIALTDKDIRNKVVKRTKEAKSSLQKWSSDKLDEIRRESDPKTLTDELQSQKEKINEEISN